MPYISIAEFKRLESRYHTILERFQPLIDDPCLENSLAYWVLHTDRNLPKVFLRHSICDLLSFDFEELSQKRGIGKKKIDGLLSLLERTLQELESPTRIRPLKISATSSHILPNFEAIHSIKPSEVTERQWRSWQQTLHNHYLTHEPIGRLAFSLQNIPLDIWNTPVDTYLQYSLLEIKGLKKYGPKRLQSIFLIFNSLHIFLEKSLLDYHLAICLRPRFIVQIKHWIRNQVENNLFPTPEDFHSKVITLILNQIQHDGGEMLYELLKSYLTPYQAPPSVIEQAEKLSVARTRIYQLLGKCSSIMKVRWSDGPEMINSLLKNQQTLNKDSAETIRLIDNTLSLLFSDKISLVPLMEHPSPSVHP
ncbi:MAG: hypothetical protein MPJ24_00130 [Pirellulaceae bacterium]|nr:hypothetical protein [Pirellulaceae bacterium]